MFIKTFQNFTVNSSQQLHVEFNYIQNLHWPVTTLRYWNGTTYVSQVSVKKAWPTCALRSIMVTQTKLSAWSGVPHFFRDWGLGCKLQMLVSHSKGWQQPATAPKARKPVRFTSRPEAEDQDYRPIWKLIFLILSKCNNIMGTQWLITMEKKKKKQKHFCKGFALYIIIFKRTQHI